METRGKDSQTLSNSNKIHLVNLSVSVGSQLASDPVQEMVQHIEKKPSNLPFLYFAFFFVQIKKQQPRYIMLNRDLESCC